MTDLRVTLDVSCLTSTYEDKKKLSKTILTNCSPKTAEYSEDLDRSVVYDCMLESTCVISLLIFLFGCSACKLVMKKQKFGKKRKFVGMSGIRH